MTKKKPLKPNQFLTLASFMCLIHCILMPILIPFIPTIGHYFESHLLEYVLLTISMLFGYWIIQTGYSLHKQKKMIVLYAIGCICWIAHTIIERLHLEGAHILLYIGSAFVLAAYLNNHSHLKQCCKHSSKKINQ